jgi:hypothetical protein
MQLIDLMQFHLLINSRKKYTVIVLVNQLVSTFFIFSFEGEGEGQSESYLNLVFCQTSNF